MPVKANLEMTAADHESIGSTVQKPLRDNPGKTLAETMSDDELNEFVTKEIGLVEKIHTEVAEGDAAKKELLEMIRDNFCLPNIVYLRRIRRLPEEFKNRDFNTEFAL